MSGVMDTYLGLCVVLVRDEEQTSSPPQEREDTGITGDACHTSLSPLTGDCEIGKWFVQGVPAHPDT